MVTSYKEFMQLWVRYLAELGQKMQTISEQEVTPQSLSSQVGVAPEYTARDMDERAAIIAFVPEKQEEDFAC